MSLIWLQIGLGAAAIGAIAYGIYRLWKWWKENNPLGKAKEKAEEAWEKTKEYGKKAIDIGKNFTGLDEAYEDIKNRRYGSALANALTLGQYNNIRTRLPQGISLPKPRLSLPRRPVLPRLSLPKPRFSLPKTSSKWAHIFGR